MTALSLTSGADRHSCARGLVLAALVVVGLGLVLSGPAMGIDHGGQNHTETDETVAPAQAGTEGPDLQLISMDYPDTIEPGEDLEITYSIENVGDEDGTESFVDLRVEGSLVDRVSNVTLEPGEVGTATFVYDGVESEFEAGDTIAFSVELVDFEDSMSGTTAVGTLDQSGTVVLDPVQTDTRSIAVEVSSLDVTDEPGWLEIENTDNEFSDVLRSVSAGDFVTVPVEDIGGVRLDDTIEVRLAADSDIEDVLDTDSTTVTAGENAPIAAFGWVPGVPEVGQPVAFDAGSSLGSGSEIVEYRWDFNNDGEFDVTTGTPTTDFVFLESGVTEVTLVVENEVGLTAEKTTPITVQGEPPESALSGLDVAEQGLAATVAAGDDESVSVTVTNVGGQAGAFDVTLAIGGAVTETRTTGELDADEEEQVTFPAVTGDLDPGAYDVTVWTDNDEVGGTMTVETALEFGVDIVETNSPTEGDNLTVTAEIENVGDGDGTGTVTLETDELGSDSRSVTLASGESVSETFTIATEAGDAGDHEVTVTSDSDASATTVTVNTADDDSLVTPILLFVLLLVLLLGAGAYYYYVHNQQQSQDGMEPL